MGMLKRLREDLRRVNPVERALDPDVHEDHIGAPLQASATAFSAEEAMA